MPPGGMLVDFQSYAGPGDKGLRSTEIEGYQPVSRIGEVVINAFVDSYEFSLLEDGLTQSKLSGKGDDTAMVEFKPHFHEVRTALSSSQQSAPARAHAR